MAEVEWLMRTATAERRVPIGEHTVIDDGCCRATIDRLQVGADLRVFLTDVEARQDLTVEAHDSGTDRSMGGQVTVAGRADIDFLDGAHTHASTDQAFLFRSSRRAAAYGLKAGTKFKSASYRMGLRRIERLFDGEVPAALRGLVEDDAKRSRIVAMRCDRAMRQLARSLFGCGLNGPLRRAMIEGAVIQLLAVQVDAAAKRPRMRRRRALGADERDAVHEARRLLLADMRRPPTLSTLAPAVGLSEKRLNVGFRLLFGGTAFEVLRNERLAHAEIALHAKAASLKEIAFRVGYNHVNNFISAFSRRYGEPPRQYLERASGHTQSERRIAP